MRILFLSLEFKGGFFLDKSLGWRVWERGKVLGEMKGFGKGEEVWETWRIYEYQDKNISQGFIPQRRKKKTNPSNKPSPRWNIQAENHKGCLNKVRKLFILTREKIKDWRGIFGTTPSSNSSWPQPLLPVPGKAVKQLIYYFSVYL